MRIQCALVVVLFVVGAVSKMYVPPTTTPAPTTSSPSEPQRCCMGKAFTAVLTDLSTINSDAIIVLHVTLDFNQQKEAAVTTIFNPTTTQTTVLLRHVFDFAQGKQYDMPENSNNCTPSPLGWPMPPQCVPADAKYLGSTFLGSPDAPLAYDGWRFSFGTNWPQATLTMTFSNATCVPILEGVQGTLDGPIDKTFMFSSYTTNVDPNVFDLRPSCNP